MAIRDELRLELTQLSDADLLKRCVTDIEASRSARHDQAMEDIRDMDWMECCRRDRRELWDQAIETVKANLAAKRNMERELMWRLRQGEQQP